MYTSKYIGRLEILTGVQNIFSRGEKIIVYRCISERELAYMIGIETYINSPHGSNTFKYERGIPYKHFFYYYESAISFMDAQNKDRYHDKYSIIMAYDILNEHFGLGQYNLECVPENLKDSLLQYFKTIYYPEFAIPDSCISTDMIVGIGTKTRITPLTREYYDQITESILESEKSFLEYEKWLFNNGTNVSINKVLQYKDNLFPIGDGIEFTKSCT